MRIMYHGPGNSWNVTGKSKLTGKNEQISDVSFLTALTFIKTHNPK